MGVDLCIRVASVVQHLHLRTGMPYSLVLWIFGDSKHDSAVAAGANLPLKGQFEVFKLLGGDDVAAIF